ncbi:MAG: toll/interleukin-1 receptor domain-containing protein [Anaerolineae bacterium]|nr:toll/interleukin-1 receptor domain-containing protein [Anaerolineae bacterium]
MVSKLDKTRSLEVFLSYAKEDQATVRKIYKQLMSEKELLLSPWLDTYKLIPGQDWKLEINLAIEKSDAVIVFFSNMAVQKEGYVQNELRKIKEVERNKPERANFVTPVLLDECEIPTDYSKWQWVEYKDKDWYKSLLLSLKERAKFLGLKNVPSKMYKIILTLDMDYSDVNDKYLSRFRSTLAKRLRVVSKDIKILEVLEGSVKIILELSNEAFRELAVLKVLEDEQLYNVLRLKEFEQLKIDDSKHSTKEDRSNSLANMSSGLKQFVYHFVGREKEIDLFEKMLVSPYGESRILFLFGGGGIGKSRLLNKMLREARDSDILAPVEPLDFFATEHRTIDGIQNRIIEIVENLTGLKEERSPFLEFRKEYKDTSEQFNRCLRDFCLGNPLVLGFDTFEVLDTVVSNWLFDGGNNGLQVPGLICVIAGRRSIAGLDRQSNNRLTKEIELSGLTLRETEEFYREHLSSIRGIDALDFWAEEDHKDKYIVKYIWEATNGHPFLIEMALNWAATLADISSDGVKGLQTFEKKIMGYVSERGDRGNLNIGSLIASLMDFDILSCMGIVTRRFDEDILRYLLAGGFIRDERKELVIKEILDPLEKYFFVKIRTGNDGGHVYQLHDEMARLLQEYVWTYRDPSGKERKALLEAVLRYYDLWIERTKEEDLKKNLRIERLYYTFKLDQFSEPIGDAGRRLWLEFADLDDDYINSYLPGEIKEYKDLYDPQTRYEVHARIAQIEYEANHISQAKKEWELIYQLGQKEKRVDWVASALFNLANCEKNPSSAIAIFLKAKRFCEKYAQDYLPRVNYNIGFAYRRLQNVEKAIEWYKKARKEFQRNPKDKALGAQIANDLGYAYSHIGEWELCQRNIDEGQAIREDIKSQLEQEVEVLEAKLKSISVKRKKVPTELQDQLTRKRKQLSNARFQLGLSHNTLGEIYRYQEKLGMSLVNYRIALTQFEMSKAVRWQAKSLFSRGETYRRRAWEKYRKGDEAGYIENTNNAEKDVQESLYICKKYRIKEERDTANRRMGRILHDRAIRELEKGRRKEARQLLEEARNHFEEGLKYAKETNDDLEILSNQTELAFIYDDFVRTVGKEKVPQEYRAAMKDLKDVLDEHRDKPFRIYQFEVFENEVKLEEAATAYQSRKYDLALRKYIDGLAGLAIDPGYGRTRYRLLFHHLTGQIENLPSKKEAEKWCRAFIQAWETPRVIGVRKTRLDREAIFPDMLEWCWKYLEKNKGV